MEPNDILILIVAILALVTGFLVGCLFLHWMLTKKKSVGNLVVEEDEKDSYLYLELFSDDDLNKIKRQEEVILIVKHISHK